MYTIANFSKQNKHIIAGKKAVNAGIGWGGTGALAGLLMKPNTGGFQRKVAVGAMGVGVANSLRKSYLPMKPKKVRMMKPRKPRVIKQKY